MKPPVLITGATGFLGSRLTRKLIEHGHVLHALARADSDKSDLDGAPITWHDGDLRDTKSIARAVDAVCAKSGARPWIVHAGAVISYRTQDRALQEDVNVEGTRRMLAAARVRPIGRFLHVSSVVAVGYAHGDELLDEDAPFNGNELACDYVSTKRRAEELALEAASEIDVVIVNPGAIFGSSARPSNSQRVLEMVARGHTGPLPFLLAPPGEQSVVGLDDTAEGCLLALECGERGRRYILVESVQSHRELIAAAAIECGRKPPRRAVPKALWKVAEALSPIADRLAPSDFLTPQTIRLAAVRFRFDGSRARRELGWNPRPFREVVHAAVEDLRRRGRL